MGTEAVQRVLLTSDPGLVIAYPGAYGDVLEVALTARGGVSSLFEMTALVPMDTPLLGVDALAAAAALVEAVRMRVCPCMGK